MSEPNTKDSVLTKVGKFIKQPEFEVRKLTPDEVDFYNSFAKNLLGYDTEAVLKIPANQKDKVIACLDEIKALFGPKGKYWVKGQWETEIEDGINSFCLSGAAAEANGPYEAQARAAIHAAILKITQDDRLNDVYVKVPSLRKGARLDELYDFIQDLEDAVENLAMAAEDVGSADSEEIIIDYNDAPQTKWKDILKVFQVAKQLVKAA